MKKMALILAVLLIGGCAVGNKYSYKTSDIDLPIRTTGGEALVLQVKDLRPYVLNGDKEANFVGLQRGGFGNPFDVTTESGEPMTDVMAVAIENGLKEAGYRVITVPGAEDKDSVLGTANSESARVVVLKVRDWKSDIYMGVTLHSDLILSIYTPDGKLLAESYAEYVKEIGGAQIGAEKNSDLVKREFEKQIGYLFNDKKVREALD